MTATEVCCDRMQAQLNWPALRTSARQIVRMLWSGALQAHAAMVFSKRPLRAALTLTV
jgi:hypothetical protein